MRKRTNPNIRRTVTDMAFAMQICQRCIVDPKNENPYWPASILNVSKRKCRQQNNNVKK